MEIGAVAPPPPPPPPAFENVDVNASGGIDLAEFSSAFSSALESARAGGMPQTPEAMFQQYDADSNQLLDGQEYSALTAALAQPAASETAAAGGGGAPPEEAAAGGEEPPASEAPPPEEAASSGGAGGGGGMSLLDMLLALFDKDGDGKLELDELPAEARAKLEKFDENGDGVIDEQELAKFEESLGGGDAAAALGASQPAEAAAA